MLTNINVLNRLNYGNKYVYYINILYRGVDIILPVYKLAKDKEYV